MLEALMRTILQSQSLPERAKRLGERMLAQLQEGLEGLSGVRAVHGLGLMHGIELERQALDRKLLIDVTGQSVIRLLPPLIITDKEAQLITHTVIDLVTNFLANSGATRGG